MALSKCPDAGPRQIHAHRLASLQLIASAHLDCTGAHALLVTKEITRAADSQSPGKAVGMLWTKSGETEPTQPARCRRQESGPPCAARGRKYKIASPAHWFTIDAINETRPSRSHGDDRRPPARARRTVMCILQAPQTPLFEGPPNMPVVL